MLGESILSSETSKNSVSQVISGPQSKSSSPVSAVKRLPVRDAGLMSTNSVNRRLHEKMRSSAQFDVHAPSDSSNKADNIFETPVSKSVLLGEDSKHSFRGEYRSRFVTPTGPVMQLLYGRLFCL